MCVYSEAFISNTGGNPGFGGGGGGGGGGQMKWLLRKHFYP